MLQIEFRNFQSKKESQDSVNLIVNQAKKYTLITSTFNQNDIMLACSNVINSYNGQVLLNNKDIQHCENSRKYLQKHTLFITDSECYFSNLTVRQNIQFFSYY